MKKIFIISALFLFVFITLACSLDPDGIKGSGNVVEQQRTINPFKELEIDGVFKVYLSQGDKEAVKVQTDDNLLDVIETKNMGDKLIITWREGADVEKSTEMNVYITVKDLEELDIEGVCDVQTTAAVNLNHLNLTSTGVGNTMLELNCKKITAQIKAVGSLTLKGEAEEAQIKSEGVGSLKAFDFIVNKLTLESRGVGNVEVNAAEEIYISSSGVGNVRHKGNAQVMQRDVNGIGSVKKL